MACPLSHEQYDYASTGLDLFLSAKTAAFAGEGLSEVLALDSRFQNKPI